jgi:RimJ/RimL family protein N-acetyltransferase
VLVHRAIRIDTPRLVLRLPEASDVNAFMEIHEEPEVIERKQVTLVGPVGSLTNGWRAVAVMVGHWHLRGYGQWAVLEKGSGQVIGCVGLYNPAGWPGIDLSWIIQRSHRGNGYAVEACRAALEWAWEATDIDHIISLIAPHDLRSIRVAERIGERFERPEADPVSGEPVHIYGIPRPDGRRSA